MTQILVPGASGEYVLLKGGREVGTESYHIERAGPELLVRGAVDMPGPQGSRQRLIHRLDRGYRVTLLELDLDAQDQHRHLRIALGQGAARLFSTGPSGEKELTLPAPDDAVILVPNVMYQFAILAARFVTESSAPMRRVLVTPSGRLGSIRLELRSASPADSDVKVFVDVDGLVGVLVSLGRDSVDRIEIPLHRMQARRRDRGPAQPEPLDTAAGMSSSAFRSEPVRFLSANQSTELGGTLTSPAASAGSAGPAVVLIGGSGLMTRDGDVPFGVRTRILRSIAEASAESGFVSLRFDKRGAGSTEDVPEPGPHAVAEDVKGALAFARSRPEVDARRLFLVGHSEGGLVAIMVAADDDRLSGIALLGTLGRPLDSTLLLQFERLAQGRMPEDLLAAEIAARRRSFDALRSRAGWDAEDVHESIKRGIPESRREWFTDHLELDPAALIGKVKYPVGIFQGAVDQQVTSQDAQLLHDSAVASGNQRCEVFVFPGLDHLFMPSEDGRLSNYADPARRVDQHFLSDLVGWLARHGSAAGHPYDRRLSGTRRQVVIKPLFGPQLADITHQDVIDPLAVPN